MLVQAVECMLCRHEMKPGVQNPSSTKKKKKKKKEKKRH
jgi:hypothetical protein